MDKKPTDVMTTPFGYIPDSDSDGTHTTEADDKSGMTLQQAKCMKCRECCEYIEIPTTMFNNQTMDYYITRGVQFGINDAGILMVRIHQPCVHLGPNGCGIYDDRPEVCKTYMCTIGDSSIKDIKNKECEDAREKVKRAIKQYINNKEDK